jgi:hypothetical protein
VPVPVGTSYVDVRPDLTNFGRELRSGMGRQVKTAGDDAARSLKSSFTGAARAAAAAFGAAFAAVQIKEFIGGSIQAASALAESMSKVGVVFDEDAVKVRSFADTAAKAIGQSEQQALEATGTFGNLFVSMGIGTGVAANMSIEIVKLASDLASFNNVNPADALDALRAGLVGETEPLRRFGVNLNDATLKQKALELGLVRSTKNALEPAIKAQAAYALVFDQTTTAQGDFARTADGLANQQRTLTAQWADAKAELGGSLMPVMVGLADVINDQVLPAWRSFFLSEDADPTNWAAKVRDAIADTVGFVLGAIQQTLRAMANMAQAVPFNWGESMARDLREAADALDVSRDKLHANTGELLEWGSASLNAESAAKLLASATKDTTSATRASLSPTKEATEAAEKSAKAKRDLVGAQRDLADAERGLNKARADRDKAAAAFAALPTDTNAEKLAEAEEDLLDATDSVSDAKDRELDAHEKVSDAEDALISKTAAVVGAIGDRTEAVKLLNEQFGIAKANMGILNDPGNILAQTTGQVLSAPPAPAAPSSFVNPGGGINPAGTLGVPNVQIPTSTKTVQVDMTVLGPAPDPGLLGKAIAWVL